MEYAKDEVFSIRYNEKKDKLEYPFFTRIFKKVANNRFMTLLITMGLFFSIVNFALIHCFFEILSKI